jgi:hypothetical protein
MKNQLLYLTVKLITVSFLVLFSFQIVDIKDLNSVTYFIRLQSNETSQSLKISINQ